jgi:phosphoribosylaminoimidazole-succinocarboxamide synthase
MKEAVTKIELQEFPLLRRGKVREVYDLGKELLIISTDRISAFDVILPQGIPAKGKVLNQISRFWFNYFGKRVKTHYISCDFEDFPRCLKKYGDILEARSMLVLKTKPIEIECVVRGYISGSAWKEYQASGEVCGIPLPKGLKFCEPLPNPIFTPTTKAAEGHDTSLTLEEAKKQFGKELVAKLKTLSLGLYRKASAYALGRGIIIADTKFEFGMFGDHILLIDEVFTPDSSRFWPAEQYEPGKSQPSLDKQLVRDYLETISWNKKEPAPNLPEELIRQTSENYMKSYTILTGERLDS